MAEPAVHAKMVWERGLWLLAFIESLFVQAIHLSVALNLLSAPLLRPFDFIVRNPVMGLAGESPIPNRGSE